MKKVLLILFLLFSITVNGICQGCAVCTKMAAGLDDKSAKGLNGGIVYLAFLPLIFMGSIGFIWWRHNKNAQ
jgi:hypothetical protein